MESYDVIVIGSGQGGNPFAIESANRGLKTALFEPGPVGGTCINTGCTPTKTMIASARVAYMARRARDYGVKTGPVQIDMKTVRKRKREIVADFSGSTEKHDLATTNLDLIRAAARFTGPKTIRADEKDYEAQTMVIDTGSLPFIPNLPGLKETTYFDSTTIMEQDTVPDHLLILGGSYVGLEFAQLFCRLGAEVTVIERSKRFLAHEDEDVADEMAKILREDGVEILLGADALSASQIGKSVRIQFEGHYIEGSHLLLALGRKPNVDTLDLSATDIETTEQGAIQVNEKLETNVAGVYAIGDVNGGPQFTHISYDDFRILRQNLFESGGRTTKERLVPYVVFTDPQLGRVGLSEQEAKKQAIEHKVFHLPMNSISRAVETAESRGFIKVLADPGTKQILGAAVLGLEGGELLNMIQIAMMGQTPYTVLAEGIFSHPTLGEGLNNLFQ